MNPITVETLSEAISIMGRVQLGKTLEDQQVKDIIRFLKSLTGHIPDDALTVPLLPPGNGE
jgi:cytochrome c peroxidase